MKKLFTLLKTTVQEWSEDKAPRLAAALSYYTVFSIPPLLVIIIGIAGLVLGREAVRDAVVAQIGGLIGGDSGKMISDIIDRAGANQGRSLIATIVGFVVLLLGASGVFGQLQDSLNTMWEVKPKPNQGIWGFIRNRFLSFGMVLVVGFLLLVSLVVSAGLSALSQAVFGEGTGILIQLLNFVVSFAVITAMFALLFKFVPQAKIAWKDVWLGAALTALLFTLGRFLIGFYLSTSSTAQTFGAASAIILLLLWVYYSAQILFFGAEFTQVYANLYGSRVVPDKDAVPVTEADRANQGIPRKEGRVLGPAGGTAASPAAGLAAGVSGAGGVAAAEKVGFSIPAGQTVARPHYHPELSKPKPVESILEENSPIAAVLAVIVAVFSTAFFAHREALRNIEKAHQPPKPRKSDARKLVKQEKSMRRKTVQERKAELAVAIESYQRELRQLREAQRVEQARRRKAGLLKQASDWMHGLAKKIDR